MSGTGDTCSYIMYRDCYAKDVSLHNQAFELESFI